jgi:hypothetical protein
MQMKRNTLAPTALSQYVGLDNCDRYLRFYLYKGETDALTRRLAQSAELTGTPWQPVQPLSGLLEEIGARIETAALDSLLARGFPAHDLEKTDPDGTVAALKNVGATPVYFYQIPMRGTLGRWVFEGRADLLRIQRNANGGLDALVIDIKASRKDKVQHRLQVAVYIRMLEQMLTQAGIRNNTFEGAIVRRDADGNLQDPAQAVPFELEPYLATVRDLTEGVSSPLERVDAVPDFRDLHYYLGARCDGCSFSPVCLTESAERQDIALVPFMESTDKRVLNAAGIKTLADLAALKQYVTVAPPSENENPPPEPDNGEAHEEPEEEISYPTAPVDPITAGPEKLAGKKLWLQTAPGKEQIVADLQKKYPLAPRLDRLIQRAAVALRQFDRTTPAFRYFVDRNTPRRMRSNLPDDKLYPNLIKIFVDVQTDYLEDKLYLASALVCANGHEIPVVKMTPGVPDETAERTLLLEWVGGIFGAIIEVANGVEAAPIHLYLYNRRDQHILLDALRRHLGALAGLPAFYRLLTDTPALNQSAIAFLYDEVRERLNLSGPLASLQVVSRQLGFNWTDGHGTNFAREFRAGIFDYGLRRNDGVYVHTSARFYSGIPLEYAYAVWGKMSHVTKRYAGTTAAGLRAFTEHRLRALKHIESAFSYKNSYIEKEPVSLTFFGNVPPLSDDATLAQVLEEFLYIEQYSLLQQHLELFARPILRRVEQGRALLARCTELTYTPISRKRKQAHAAFLAEFDKVGMNALTALQVSKLKEGDFVTLTPLDEDGQPWKIVGGRLARIEDFTGEYIRLELSGSTLTQGQKSGFRYRHARDLQPAPGYYYMIDPMVDNLNGDKLLEACRFADSNRLYRLATSSELRAASRTEAISHQPSAISSEHVQPNHQSSIINHQFLAEVRRVEGDERAPTADQLAVIGGFEDAPLFLVQGPPGTGKSHTLGWAILARIYAAVREAEQNGGRKPGFRVLVSSQTHNAVEIVLESVASKWHKLIENHSPLCDAFSDLEIFKVGGSDKTVLPLGVAYIDPWDNEAVKRVFEGAPPPPPPKKRGKAKQAEPEPPPEPELTDGRVLVVGATPGNVYNLMKEYFGRAKKKQEVVWHEKYFDLLVLDEASQVNLPHALLAAGWLHADGKTIIVGDHRQLSPILAHGWEREEHLPAHDMKPYRSVFQFFLDAGYPRVALNESFRLHSAQADFLQQHIYRQDGIKFHSRRQKRLPFYTPAAHDRQIDFVSAVLHPDYPVIVVEHSEAQSQQYNPVEVELLQPLITAATGRLGLDGADGIGIVVPHRAQKAILQEKFPALARAGAIDTVERFQGGERDLIIVSTTASDPDYIASEAEFLLSPNRFNVALSRPRCKLVLVASHSVFQFVTARLELFEQAILWKRLAQLCRQNALWEGEVQAGVPTSVYGIKG